MSSIEENAKLLAQSLKETSEFEKLQSTQARLKLDPGATDLLNELQEHHDTIQKAQMSGQQVSPEKISEFQTLQQQSQQNLTIKALFEAQQEFNDVMEKVNHSIMEELFQ